MQALLLLSLLKKLDKLRDRQEKYQVVYIT